MGAAAEGSAFFGIGIVTSLQAMNCEKNNGLKCEQINGTAKSEKISGRGSVLDAWQYDRAWTVRETGGVRKNWKNDKS